MSKIRRREKGQSLILIAILLVVFIGILALVLDGGYSYFMRRNAQNAADAGALAGARVYCESLDVGLGKLEAIKYVHENEALVYPVDDDGNDDVNNIVIAGNKVTVDTVIKFNNFFGNIFGRSESEAVAHAVAGCFSPTLAEGVLPIIWFCKPSVSGDLGESDECIEQFIEYPLLNTYLAEDPYQLHEELYIVMDSLSYNVDFPCIEDGQEGAFLICDLDGDGDKDHFAGSGRSWTDLDGKTGKLGNPDCPPSQDQTTELIAWILEGFGCALNTHTWTPEVTGDVDKIFQAIECRINQAACGPSESSLGPLVLLPVYDDFCLNDTPDPNIPFDCDQDGDDDSAKWHEGDEIRYTDPAYFHIVQFAPFYITCVRGPGKSVTPTGLVSTCPGYEAFKLNNSGVIPNIQSVASVEGYFLHGYVPGLKGRGDDGFLDGVFTVYLDE